MTDTAPGLLLGEIRMRGYRNGALGALAGRLSDCAAIDVPRLLAAVEAVLAKAEEWAPPLHPLEVLSEGAERSSYLFAARYERRDCAAELRKLIAGALLGDDDG